MTKYNIFKLVKKFKSIEKLGKEVKVMYIINNGREILVKNGKPFAEGKVVQYCLKLEGKLKVNVDADNVFNTTIEVDGAECPIVGVLKNPEQQCGVSYLTMNNNLIYCNIKLDNCQNRFITESAPIFDEQSVDYLFSHDPCNRLNKNRSVHQFFNNIKFFHMEISPVYKFLDDKPLVENDDNQNTL